MYRAYSLGEYAGRVLWNARPELRALGCDVSELAVNTVFLELLERIESHVRRHELIEPGGEVLCLVSGGADSTCLFHALRELGYRVSALHVDHGLRGAESDEDARWCAERFGADASCDAPRRDRGRAARPALRARRPTGCARPATRLATRSRRSSTGSSTSGSRKGIKPRREDGVVRPLLCVWREETEAFCRSAGSSWRDRLRRTRTRCAA